MDARNKGARVLTRTGETTDEGEFGRFFYPTLVADCTHFMDIMTEETFGPVMAVASVASDEEAIVRMNDSKYGLTSAIYTTDRVRLGRVNR